MPPLSPAAALALCLWFALGSARPLGCCRLRRRRTLRTGRKLGKDIGKLGGDGSGGSGSGLGTGGMATKLKAAQIVTEVGCQMVIANGSKPALLYDIVGGKPVGTRFLAKEK